MTRRMKILVYGLPFLALVFLFDACKKDVEIMQEAASSPPFYLELPPGFPDPDIPVDNEFTTERVALGKKLFYDPILSKDSSLSCGSCHFQQNAFSDVVPFSKGFEGREGFRNAPTLTNVAYAQSFFHDGGVPTLEQQVFVPIEDKNEMNLNIVVAIERLKNHPEYPALFKEAYGREEVDAFGLTRAIAAFERTLISGNSRFDQYYFQGKENALTASEKRGYALFSGEKLNCSKCHSGFNFTNGEYENNGLYQQYTRDTGRARITLKITDAGKFKVPTLRNIELTAPYMHDGSLATLEDVVSHYAKGGEGHVNQSELVHGFQLTASEKTDLINFLKSLTDHDFITNPDFRPE